MASCPRYQPYGRQRFSSMAAPWLAPARHDLVSQIIPWARAAAADSLSNVTGKYMFWCWQDTLLSAWMAYYYQWPSYFGGCWTLSPWYWCWWHSPFTLLMMWNTGSTPCHKGYFLVKFTSSYSLKLLKLHKSILSRSSHPFSWENRKLLNLPGA